jgi:hypothetical protein
MPPRDERAAKERKQKIFVLIGGVLLLALLAFQLPRILGGESASAPPTEETVVGQPSPTETGTSVRAPAVLVNPDLPPAPAEGQLSSFSEFDGNDPFVQQVTFDDAPAAGAEPQAGKEGDAKASSSSGKGFTIGGTPSASVTVIAVNGVRQTLSTGTAFPSSDPVFVLVSEQQAKKTVTIGVAGGEYSSGAKTTKLVVGKPLVLVNTTTGARYRLVLVAVGNGGATPSPENGSGKDTPSPPPDPSTP